MPIPEEVHLSKKRAPLAERIPRPAKLGLDRHAESDIPAHIRAEGVSIDAGDRAYLRRKLGTKLGRFARAIERVSVRIRDVNGRRGGIDKVCAIKVVLTRLPSVVVETQHASLQAAMDTALQGIERAVRRSLKRRTARARGAGHGGLEPAARPR
jgi:ribosome-associated translation inhibitor RaiA